MLPIQGALAGIKMECHWYYLVVSISFALLIIIGIWTLVDEIISRKRYIKTKNLFQKRTTQNRRRGNT